MRRHHLLLAMVLSVLIIVSAACASAALPPVPTPATPPVSAIPPARETAASSAAGPDDAWESVVQAAKKEGKITLYTFFFIGDTGKAVAQAFERRYGIRVEMVTGVGTVLMERIRSEAAAGKYIADTLDTALSLVVMAKQGGLTQSWGALPVFSEKGVWTLDPRADAEGHILTGSVAHMTPYINTTQVKLEEEPKTVIELLRPQWAGQKLIIASPLTSPNLIWWYVAKLIDDDFLTKLARNNPRIALTTRDALDALVRGDAAIHFPESDQNAPSYMARGAPIKPIELAEGVQRNAGGPMTMVKNAPHPNASRVFANWLLSKEGQTTWHQAQSTTPIRKDLPSFLPPAANVSYKKVSTLGLNEMLEAARLQREGVIAKLMGIEK